MQVMLEREEATVLSGRIEVDDAYVGGESHEGKRGRGPPGIWHLKIHLAQATQSKIMLHIDQWGIPPPPPGGER